MFCRCWIWQAIMRKVQLRQQPQKHPHKPTKKKSSLRTERNTTYRLNHLLKRHFPLHSHVQHLKSDFPELLKSFLDPSLQLVCSADLKIVSQSCWVSRLDLGRMLQGCNSANLRCPRTEALRMCFSLAASKRIFSAPCLMLPPAGRIKLFLL